MTIIRPTTARVQTLAPGTIPQPDGYRIVHTFQHQSCDTGTEEERIERTVETVDVTSWDDIAPVLNNLFLYTGSGYTLTVTITPLHGPAEAWHQTPTANPLTLCNGCDAATVNPNDPGGYCDERRTA